MITDHTTARRICEWKFPHRFLQAKAGWTSDGESLQTYIDREWSWQDGATPVTALEIEGAEAEWRARPAPVVPVEDTMTLRQLHRALRKAGVITDAQIEAERG